MAELVARIGMDAVLIEKELGNSIERACVIIEKSAKGAIGTYEFGWEPLAEATIARKDADTPLLETGELRDSYQHNSDTKEGYVGSDNPKAEWHEFGTSKIPARPVLGGAMIAVEDEMKGMLVQMLEAVIGRP